jgi:hypothetical protein
MGAYGTLNILKYNAYLNGTNMGLVIKLGLNNTTGYKNLNWVQVVTTNSPLRNDLKSPYFDHMPNNPTPFYRIGSDLNNNLVNVYEFDFAFYDNPSRSMLGNDISWQATLTLVGVQNNSYTPLFTISYGFTIQGGIYHQIPMSYSTPIPVSQTFSPSFPKNGP